MESKSKIDNYQIRETKWADKTATQLSFYNNLLITISIGFLSIGYKPDNFKGLKFAITNIDIALTLKVISIVFILFSILTGLLLALNRLIDYRLTRKINQIRKLVYKSNGSVLDDQPKQDYTNIKKFTLIFILIFAEPKISLIDCYNFKK